MLLDNITQDLNTFILQSRIFNGPFKIDEYFNEKKDRFYIEKLEQIQNSYPDATELEEVIESYIDKNNVVIKKTELRIITYIPKPKVIEIPTYTTNDSVSDKVYKPSYSYSKSSYSSSSTVINSDEKPRFIKTGYRPPVQNKNLSFRN